MTPQQANLSPCPFCGGAARHLEKNPGFYDERAICDPCNYSLSPAAWNRRAPAPTEPAVDRDADPIGDFQREAREAKFSEMVREWQAATPASPAVPAVPAAPTTILPTNESEK